MKTINIIGGGTFSHVRNHLALAAPAYGHTARKLAGLFGRDEQDEGYFTRLELSKMANSGYGFETNEDVAKLVDEMVANPDTRAIIMNAALCDFEGSVLDRNGFEDGYDAHNWTPTDSGKYTERLKTKTGEQTMVLTPADKIIGRIRRERKDIFLVAFKTTCGATPQEQYLAALDLLKRNSANLVVANDTKTRLNMIVAPEETRYFETTDRDEVLTGLVQMVKSRMSNTFTRSTVIEGDLVDFQTSPLVPDNFRTVVNHLTKRGAYKPFNGSTAGHFAVRVDDGRVLTSRRKTNYTVEGGLDLVEVSYDGLDRVIARGAKPSVGGQSQRIVFTEHEDLDCIVHAHVPLRSDAVDVIPTAEQWRNECGSHQCGANTSRNLKAFGHGIHAVMLQGHGPNVVFSRSTPPEAVIGFIERNFALEEKTGGLVERELADATV